MRDLNEKKKKRIFEIHCISAALLLCTQQNSLQKW